MVGLYVFQTSEFTYIKKNKTLEIFWIVLDDDLSKVLLVYSLSL